MVLVAPPLEVTVAPRVVLTGAAFRFVVNPPPVEVPVATAGVVVTVIAAGVVVIVVGVVTVGVVTTGCSCSGSKTLDSVGFIKPVDCTALVVLVVLSAALGVAMLLGAEPVAPVLVLVALLPPVPAPAWPRKAAYSSLQVLQLPTGDFAQCRRCPRRDVCKISHKFLHVARRAGMAAGHLDTMGNS